MCCRELWFSGLFSLSRALHIYRRSQHLCVSSGSVWPHSVLAICKFKQCRTPLNFDKMHCHGSPIRLSSAPVSRCQREGTSNSSQKRKRSELTLGKGLKSFYDTPTTTTTNWPSSLQSSWFTYKKVSLCLVIEHVVVVLYGGKYISSIRQRTAYFYCF